MNLSRPRLSRLLWVSPLVLLVLYAAFPTRSYYWDGVLFALNIESVAAHAQPPAILLHPNHLLYSAFGYALFQFVHACGFEARAITVLQLSNAIFATVAAVMVYAVAKRSGATQLAAFFAALLFACGAIWWKFATDANAYIPSVALLLLALWFMLDGPPRLAAAAACHALAMLFHELSIFVYAPVLLAILLYQPWTQRKRVLAAAAYVIATGACVFAAYEFCYFQSDRKVYPSLARWITSFASDSGFTHSARQLAGSYVSSFLKLFLGGKLSLIRESFSILPALAFLVCLVALIAAILALRRPVTARPAFPTPDRRAILVLWAWLVPYAVFLASWDPGSTFHKLFLWPAVVLLIALYWANSARREQVALALAVAAAAWNFGAYIFPHARADADPVVALALRIDRELPKNATIYYAAFSPDDWYLDYFAPGRNWIRLEASPHAQPPHASGPVCLETTALAGVQPTQRTTQQWDLVNAQHNVRLHCLDFQAPR